MNDLIPGSRLEGEILIDGRNIYDKSVQVDELRKSVGMVFQRPNRSRKVFSRMWLTGFG